MDGTDGAYWANIPIGPLHFLEVRGQDGKYFCPDEVIWTACQCTWDMMENMGVTDCYAELFPVLSTIRDLMLAGF